MTIKIKITNEDSRENAIVCVKKAERLDKSVFPAIGASWKKEELKGGESTEVYVYDGQSIVIEEVRNG